MERKAVLNCPICGRSSEFFAAPMGPFCSTRCKTVDLGKWLGEDYKITEPLRADHLMEYENMEGPELDIPER